MLSLDSNENSIPKLTISFYNKFLFAISLLMIAMAILIPVGFEVFANSTLQTEQDISHIEMTVNYSDSISEYTIANQMDVVLNLRQEVWETLSLDQKINALDVVVKIESRYWGIPYEINITVEGLSTGISGAYSNSKHLIYLDKDYLSSASAKSILDTIAHEMHHCYQYCLVELYEKTDELYVNLIIFNDAKKYEENFNNYQSGKEDIRAYWLRPVEKSARKFARDAVDEYYEKINRYLEEKDDLCIVLCDGGVNIWSSPRQGPQTPFACESVRVGQTL